MQHKYMISTNEDPNKNNTIKLFARQNNEMAQKAAH